MVHLINMTLSTIKMLFVGLSVCLSVRLSPIF